MDNRIKVDGAQVPNGRNHHWRPVAAVLIVMAISTALVPVQRPHITTERAGEEAIAISEAFIDAHGNWDHQAARSLVSDTATISINPARSPEDLEMEIAWMEATGWVFTTTGCSVTRGLTGDGADASSNTAPSSASLSRVGEVGRSYP